MAIGISNGLSGQKLNNQSDNQNAATNSKKDSQVDIQIDTLIVNIFFDGTMNNMFNSNLRTDGINTTAQQDMAKQTSYKNDLSNVALLYMAATKIEGEVENIYIPGAGTLTESEKNYQHDSVTVGGGISRGDSGVNTRVEKAINELKRIANVNPNRWHKLYIHVFGFSRGAFYARHFCSKIKGKTFGWHITDASPLRVARSTKDDVVGLFDYIVSRKKDKHIQINMVGIYDTVSSEGAAHYNDVGEWALDIGKKQVAGRIIHLTAQNDYRLHFPLTHIQQAIDDGVGFECSFPGAHSDIGGGYNANYYDSPEPTFDIYSDPTLNVFSDLKDKPSDYKYISVLDRKHDSPACIDGEIGWEWFKEMGYYRGDPTSSDPIECGEFKLFNISYVERHYFSSNQTKIAKGVAVRHKTRHKIYQFILANVMKEVAEELAAIKFEGAKKAKLVSGIAEMKQDELLGKIDEYASDFVKKNYKKPGNYKISFDDVNFSKEQQQTLYHDYLHNSLLANDTPIAGANRGVPGQTTPPKRAEINDTKRDWKDVF